MAVKIRLRRMGGKKDPFYRIVVSDARSPRDGRFIEELGYYNPAAKEEVLDINEDKAVEWMLKGAHPSDTVKALFRRRGIMEKYRQAKKQA